MSLMRINPLREFQEVQNAMNRVFGDNLSRFFGDTERSFVSGNWAPPADVYETQNDLVFLFELPGFEKDQIKITINEGQLFVSGERPVDEKKDVKYHQVERWYGSFHRSFVLPTSIQADRIAANLKNGVLTITLPKREEAKPRQIAVNVQ